MEIAKALRVLGVTHRTSLREAKSAYRRLAKAWHPDRFQGGPEARREAEEKMKTINAAYRVATRFLSGNRASSRKEETPWWSREEATPPASARAIRRPLWFRGFSFGDPCRYRDDIGDYVGALLLVLAGLCLFGWAIYSMNGSPTLWAGMEPFKFLWVGLLLVCAFRYFRMAVQSMRD